MAMRRLTLDLRGTVVRFDSHREAERFRLRAVVVVDELANLLRQALG